MPPVALTVAFLWLLVLVEWLSKTIFHHNVIAFIRNYLGVLIMIFTLTFTVYAHPKWAVVKVFGRDIVTCVTGCFTHCVLACWCPARNVSERQEEGVSMLPHGSHS